MSFNALGKFSEPGLLVLTSLADGPKHGYAMIEDIEAMTGMRLGAGTLYGAIIRLEEQGLIEPLYSEDRRKPYRLTAKGVTYLAEQLNRLNSLILRGLERLEARQ